MAEKNILVNTVVAEYLRHRDRIEAAWEQRDSKPAALREAIIAVMEHRVAVYHTSTRKGIRDVYRDEVSHYALANEAERNEAIGIAERQIRDNLETDGVTAKLLSASNQASTLMRVVFHQLRYSDDWLAVVTKHQAALARVLVLRTDMNQRASIERDRMLDVLMSICHDCACRNITDNVQIHDLFIEVWGRIAGPCGLFFIAEQPATVVPTAPGEKKLPVQMRRTAD